MWEEIPAILTPVVGGKAEDRIGFAADAGFLQYRRGMNQCRAPSPAGDESRRLWLRRLRGQEGGMQRRGGEVWRLPSCRAEEDEVRGSAS